MSWIVPTLWMLFGIGAAGTASFFCYGPMLFLGGRRPSGKKAPPFVGELPALSLIVAVRNGEALIEEKARNSLELDYPADRLQVIVSSDGSDDRTVELLRALDDPRLTVLECVEHRGKAAALNDAMDCASGELLVFTDADAVLVPEALRHLVAPFSDAEVGGVVGQRTVHETGDLAGAQSDYIRFDSRIKLLESQKGSVTSNDGKLYAIHRDCRRPVAEGVTDDLWMCLQVIDQGRRFVFAPQAVARVRTPSRDVRHELGRRRRVVSRSLRGIWRMRRLLNPLRHGRLAIGLIVNKVFRRLLPVFLICLLVPSWGLGVSGSGQWNVAFLVFAALQTLFYVGAALQPLIGRFVPGRRLRKLHSAAFYFCVGNVGNLLGLLDVCLCRKVVRWDPRKTA